MGLLSLGTLPGLSAMLQSCGVDRLSDYQPLYLSSEQFDTVWKLADLILPATDSPGASDAGVAPYIDMLLKDFLRDDEKKPLEFGIKAFMEHCKNQKGLSFMELQTSAQLAFMKQEQNTDFFRSFKQLVLWAFFTSEVGMKSMNYQPIPGGYQGCISIGENEKNIVGNR